MALCLGLVPRVGIEPTLLAERDFESRASTNFATEASEQTAEFATGVDVMPAPCRSGGRTDKTGTLRVFAFAPAPRMPPIPPVTQALMLINVGIFCLQFLMRGLLEPWFALWPLNSGFLPWQLISYGFLHGDMFHLFFNMLALWMFGAELEQLWGPKRYLIFLAAGILFGGLAFIVLTTLMDWRALLVGFSGGIFALLFASAMLFPNRTIMPLFPPIPMKMKTFAIVFGVIELVIGVTSGVSGLSNFAHLGGVLGGFLMIRYWRGQAPFGRRR